MDVKPIQVKLIAPHEHAGVVVSAGSALTLDADAAAWLIATGVAVLVEPAAISDELPSPGDAPAPTPKKGKR